MPTNPLPPSLWQSNEPPFAGQVPLYGDITADAVIVGGGFTGCSAALHAAEAGMAAVVLEAGFFGAGGAGRNAGLLNPGSWLLPSQIEGLVPGEKGRRLSALLDGSTEAVAALVRSHGIDCDLVMTGNLHCAISSAGLATIRGRHVEYQARGARVDLLDAATATRLTGANGLKGALLDHRAGSLQPYRYLKGLAGAAQTAGARLYHRSPAQAITHRGGLWRVETPRGSVRARHLLVATNAYPQAPLPNVRAAFVPVYYFQFATRRLTEAERVGLLPEGRSGRDTAVPMTSFRLSPDGRLVLGSVGGDHLPTRVIHAAWARRKMHRLFPQLRGVPFEHHWGGRLAFSADHLPRLIELGPNGICLHAYNGRGIGAGTEFGRLYGNYLVGDDVEVFPLPVVAASEERADVLRASYFELGATVKHAVSDW